MISESASAQYVGDVCTNPPVFSVEGDVALSRALFYMATLNTDVVGVVDKDGRCIGYVTYDDAIYYNPEEKGDDPNISKAMRELNMFVYLDDPTDQALIMMDLYDLNFLPVVDFDTQRFSGLICREDVEHSVLNFTPMLEKKVFYENEFLGSR